MAQPIESTFSDEDYQLIATNQLGTAVGIYRLKTGYIRFFRWSGLFLIIVGIAILVSVVSIGLTDWYQSLILHQQHPHSLTEALHLQEAQEQADLNFHMLLTPLLAGLFSLLGGLVCLCIGVPHAQIERIIVCEHGMLHINRRFWGNRIEVVEWNDITTIRKAFLLPEYSIGRRDGEALVLGLYQDIDELILLIRQRSGVIAS